MSETYEYIFEEMFDYISFAHNCYLDFQEVIIKPIVNKYYQYSSDLIILRTDNEIQIRGNIFQHNVNVVYRSDEIIITYSNESYRLCCGIYIPLEKWKYIEIHNGQGELIGLDRWIYKRASVPDKLPPNGNIDNVTIIIHMRIPELTKYMWNLWNDIIPNFDPIVDQFSQYIRAFYIDINEYMLTDESDTVMMCDNKIIERIRNYAPNEDNSIFDPLVSHRWLTSACVMWRIRTNKRKYSQCIESIPYLPQIGVYYNEARDEFNNIK